MGIKCIYVFMSVSGIGIGGDLPGKKYLTPSWLVMCAAVGRDPRSDRISLRLLVEKGILAPGKGVLSKEYKGSIIYADLTAEGEILFLVSLHI